MAPPAPMAQPAPMAPPAPGWYGAPPVGYGPTPYAAHTTAGTSISKPIGIILLAFVEAGIAAVGIWVALGLFFGTVSDFAYGDFGYSCIDLVDGLAFFVGSGAGIVLIVGIWKMRSIAWVAAHVLSAVLTVLILANAIFWGLNLLDVIGVVVNLTVLASLNTNPIRRNFGRRPLF
ncbi:MAG TPA: hypothetical protein VF337_09750 [Candidatus Limnocylindrales bacterium]